jgi:hypothetical protein
LGGMSRAKPHRVVVLAVLSSAVVFCAWDSWVSFVVSSSPGRDNYWVSAKGQGRPWPKGAASVFSSSWLGSRGRGMRFKRGVRRDQRPEWQRPGEVWAGFPEAVARYSQTQKESWIVRVID